MAVAVSFWRRADLEKDIGIAVVRSFIQLTAIGYVINFIFDQDSLWFVVALIAVMVLFGALQARQRAKQVPDAFWPLLLALALAAAATLGLVVALGVFKPQPRYLVPVGGMVVGNSMTAAAVALNRLGDEMARHAREIEATLALGATSTQAAAPIVRRSLRSGMITLIDSTKTTGLVFFPGTMVGMLLAGADPTDAVRLQLILLYTLLGSVALAGLDRGHAGLPQLLHPGAPAPRAAAAVKRHLTPELWDFILRWLPERPARVLDIGCGDGTLTRRLIAEGYDATGLDPEAPREEGYLRDTLEEFRSTATFDAAVAVRSLHHLRDPVLGLDNLRASLRPGGRLVAFEFAVEHLDDDARRWLSSEGVKPPVSEPGLNEVIPLGELRAELERRFGVLDSEPATYLAREGGREDLVGAEEAAVRAGILRPAGIRLAYERLPDS